MSELQKETYREEARELLADLEATLLELESTPKDGELIGRAFRALHTIKGSGAMFGFDNIARFTHDIENAYDHVRSGKLEVSQALIDLTLTSCDLIRAMIEDSGDASEVPSPADAEAISGQFRRFTTQALEPAASEGVLEGLGVGPASSTSSNGTARVTYRIHFRPRAQIFAFGTNPLLLLGELRELGPCTVVAHTDTIPTLEEMDPESCYTWWDIILTTARSIDAIKDVFIFVEDDCELKIEAIDHVGDEEEEPDYRRLGEILVDRGDISSEELRQIVTQRKLIGELLLDSGLVGSDTIEAALAEQEHVREIRRQRKVDTASASLRVPAEKLDSLVNLVGELVTVQSRLNQLSSLLNHPELIQISEEVERLTADLRDTTMSIRMLPIGTTFKKFGRLLHDLAQELGKEVKLETTGAETELDKTVIEKLGDPLVHMIRNCIDHGIEAPDVRVGLGKPRHGTVRLSARHEGANVMIEIRDDGAGIRRSVVRQKAIDAGLLAPDAAIPDKDLLALIFAPGFSTAHKVTKLSGRGVGLDVVKRSIESLGGTLDVESEEGKGTVIQMKLPLTLAIIDGLLVQIDDAYFVLPLSAIQECVEITGEERASRHGQNLAFIRGELVPYIPLRQRFNIEGGAPRIEQIVTTRYDGHRVGLLVDQVVGQHQTVIKGLGRMFREVEEFSGATILGDGTVALIIDLPTLIRKVEREEAGMNGSGGGAERWP